MSTTTTTVTLPCPECGEDISRQACIGHDRTNGLRVVTGEQARTAPPAPHFIICGRCDAVWTTGLVPADQAERELRAYLAADKNEQEES